MGPAAQQMLAELFRGIKNTLLVSIEVVENMGTWRKGILLKM